MTTLIVLAMLLTQGFSTGPSTQAGDGISDGSSISNPVVNAKKVGVVPAPRS